MSISPFRFNLADEGSRRRRMHYCQSESDWNSQQLHIKREMDSMGAKRFDLKIEILWIMFSVLMLYLIKLAKCFVPNTYRKLLTLQLQSRCSI